VNRRINVRFDAVAQRWEIADDGHGGRNELQAVSDEISVGRNAAGVVMELVIDLDNSASASPSARQLADETFGAQVASLLDRPQDGGDFETVIDITTLAPVPTTSSPLSVHSATTSTPIAGEPGVPVALAAGRYTIPAGETHLTLEVHADRLVIRARRGSSAPGSWAVVAEANSGDVLALGPMEPSGDGGTSAHLAFGLPNPPESLFVAVTDEPLAPIEGRVSRQRRWAFQLLDTADGDLRLRPRRAKQSARQAATVGATLNDARITDRASRVERRAQRRMWWWLGGAGLMIAAVGIAIAATSGSGSTPPPAPSSSTLYFENCDAARAAGPTPLNRDDPGYRPGLDRDGDGIACEG